MVDSNGFKTEQKSLNLTAKFDEKTKILPQKSSEVSRTGIAGFDSLVAGGFPKGQVIMISSSSGCGKTIFALQWLFKGAEQNENGVYITLTEPLFMTLKNLETLSFYRREIIESEKIKIIDLRSFHTTKQFDQKEVLKFIENQVIAHRAKRLCIDSITAIAYKLEDKGKIRTFIFELGKLLATLGCTTILTSEVGDTRKLSVYGVEEFISDAIIKLDQVESGGHTRRKLKVVKVRGRSFSSQEAYFKITHDGIKVFDRNPSPLEFPATTQRVSCGNTRLDSMFRGGIFKGSSTYIAGSTGTGKSMFGLHFIIEGLKKKEESLYIGFEESKQQLTVNAKKFNADFGKFETEGILQLRCVYPADKFIEEHLEDIKSIVLQKGIKRCVVDSLSALSNAFPEEDFVIFSKNLYSFLKMNGVTTFFTSATDSLIGTSTLSGSQLSTITDNIVMLRHVEMEGELRQILNIVKVKGSEHSKRMRLYEITENGVEIGSTLSGYEGAITGVMRKVSQSIEEKLESEFKRYIGPMGIQSFAELSERGITKSRIFAYIESLTKQRIMNEKTALNFKDACKKILESKEESNEVENQLVNAVN